MIARKRERGMNHGLDRHIIAARQGISNEVTYWISRRRSRRISWGWRDRLFDREREREREGEKGVFRHGIING